MKYKKDIKTNEKSPILTKDDFLKVLDRAIKPPDQETQRTDEILLVIKGYSPNLIYLIDQSVYLQPFLRPPFRVTPA